MAGPMKLVFRNGPRVDEEIEIDREMVLGREGADIEIEDSAVSRRHALVRPSGDDLEIEDLDSTNGTFVNGARIDSPTRLGQGDFVNIGQSTLEFAGFDWRSAETQALSIAQDEEAQDPDEYVPTAPIAIDTDGSKSPLSSVPRVWILVAAALLVVVVIVVAVSALTGGPSKEELLDEADGICRRSQTALKDVKLSPKEKPPALSRDAGRLLQGRTSVAEALLEIEFPREMEDRFRSYRERASETNAQLRSLQRLDRKAKKKRVESVLSGVRKAAGAETKAARNAGLRVCGGLPV